jgi:hypothetical protein
VPIALNLNGLTLPRPGAYRVIVSIDGTDLKTLTFRVEALADRAKQTPQQPATGTAGYL